MVNAVALSLSDRFEGGIMLPMSVGGYDGSPPNAADLETSGPVDRGWGSWGHSSEFRASRRSGRLQSRLLAMGDGSSPQGLRC